MSLSDREIVELEALCSAVVDGSASDDHITVFQQMAAKYPSMDLSRVGVWGHSAGGYDSTHAILGYLLGGRREG